MMYWRLAIEQAGFGRRSFVFNTAGEAFRFLAQDEDRVGTDPRRPDTRVTLVRNHTARRSTQPRYEDSLPPPAHDAAVWA